MTVARAKTRDPKNDSTRFMKLHQVKAVPMVSFNTGQVSTAAAFVMADDTPHAMDAHPVYVKSPTGVWWRVRNSLEAPDPNVYQPAGMVHNRDLIRLLNRHEQKNRVQAGLN